MSASGRSKAVLTSRTRESTRSEASPHQHAERDDYSIQLEVEREAAGKPIAAHRHKENDDQDQRDQAIPTDHGRVSDGHDGGEGEEQREDADLARAQDTEREQSEGACNGDHRELLAGYAEDCAHDD